VGVVSPIDAEEPKRFAAGGSSDNAPEVSRRSATCLTTFCYLSYDVLHHKSATALPHRVLPIATISLGVLASLAREIIKKMAKWCVFSTSLSMMT
jgi:hypothetical protein